MSNVQSPSLRRETRKYDVVVCGGGMSGVGAAMTAARHGAKVALIQDRPVLGGNGSKEVRVWLQGASGGANAMWFRETGLMEEILLENQYRNPTGQAEIWDSVLLDAVLGQKNLDLLLNTCIIDVAMNADKKTIKSITAATLQSELMTTFEAPYFIDCTGDGTVGYLAGAPYMTGREAKSEFGESMAPEKAQTNTLGGSIMFLSKDIGRPVPFRAPNFAHKFTEKDFRHGRNPVHEFERIRGGFWWIEWGGTLDTIHDNEAIKYELMKIAYGIFDWLKNDPSQKEKNKNITLEWVGTVPGKRESRRFIGDHILTQQDVIERRDFADAVAFGGWNLDDHAPLGFFDDVAPPSTHTQIPGTYNIPLRSLYSKSIDNLLFAGRNVSATHVALTSVRVMLTCAQMGEAAGAAAALSVQKNTSPRQIANGELMTELRERLLRDDHHIIGAKSEDRRNLARGASVKASSAIANLSIEQTTLSYEMDKDRMLMVPSYKGALPGIDVLLSAREDTTVGWQLHRADGRGLTIPQRVLAEGGVSVKAGGTQWVRIPLNASIDVDDWSFVELKKNPAVIWHGTRQRRIGVKSFVEGNGNHGRNTNNHSRFGIMRGEQNYCFRMADEPRAYQPENAVNGEPRPFKTPNVWVSRETKFEQPEWLEVSFGKTAPVSEVMFLFDSDLDRHLTNTWVDAPYSVEPDLVKDYDVELRVGGQWTKVAEVMDNHHRRRTHTLDKPVSADAMRLVIKSTNGTPRAQVYDVRAY